MASVREAARRLHFSNSRGAARRQSRRTSPTKRNPAERSPTMNRSTNAGAMIAVFFGGAAAGAAVALLTSNRAGPENRKALRQGLRKQVDTVSHIPQAIRAASSAASNAFTGHMNGRPQADFQTKRLSHHRDSESEQEESHPQ